MANWLGNPPQNQGLFSFLMVVVVVLYVIQVLKPFGLGFKFPKR